MSWTTYVRVCALVLAGLTGPSQPCTPLRPDPNTFSPAQKSYLFESAFMGTVTNTVPDDHPSNGTNTVYTATMQIYCIFKGPSLSQVIDIPNAGFIDDYCVKHDLEVGEEYIVLLQPETSPESDDVSYRLGMVIPAMEENSRNFTAACGLEIQPPEGADASSTHIDNCPLPAPADQCEDRDRRVHDPVGPPAQPPPPNDRTDRDGDGDHDEDDHLLDRHHDDSDVDGDGDHDDDDHHNKASRTNILDYFLSLFIPLTVILFQ